MRLLAVACGLALVATACVPGPDVTPTVPDTGPTSSLPDVEPLPGPDVVKSPLDRLTSTDVTEDELAILVGGNVDFALDLYGAVAEGLNVFLSPYSAAEALTMTYAGAAGETAQEMASTLRVALPDDRQHAARNELNLRLQEPPEEGQEPFTVSSVNRLWGQRSYPFVPDFLDLLAVQYDAGMNVVDFAADPDGAREAINESVAEDTEQRITDLLPEGVIDALTRLVLVNAVYFKASWLLPFETEDTVDGTFTTRDGRTVNVPMMHQSGQLPYFEGDGLQAARLPYSGPASMLIMAPDDFDSFRLTPETLEAIRAGLSVHQLDLTMPRFTFRSSFPLREALSGMGMNSAFLPPPGPGTADFTGITPPRELYIQEVMHEAFVAVDEAGTEAAAATAVVIGLTSASPPATLKLDRPFLFLIQHDETGEIIFLGHVGEPLQSGE